MRDALLLVDVLADFRHEEGSALLESFASRQSSLVAALGRARAEGVPIVYANDNRGIWDGDVHRLVRSAVEEGLGGALVAEIGPRPGDRFVVKPRYSGFDHTPLELILRSLEIERILLAGTATEMCVTQTAVAARELGFKVTVLAGACASADPRLEALALEYLEAVVGVVIERV
jgi:nicotinamidase-related amidase